MTLGGIRLRVHPLMPLVLALMYMLSGGQALIPSLIALGLHESAHLLVALKVQARIDEIELMPFGAAIRLYELWEISSARLLLISLAGPLMNFVSAAAFSLFVYVFPGLIGLLTPVIRMSLALALINLVPALPLDGGRAFCALLSARLPRAKCVRIGVRNGKILALVLFVGAGAYLATARKLHLGLILAAIYIFASGEREKQQAEGASLRMFLLSTVPLATPAFAKWILVRASDTLLSASRLMESGSPYLFCVVDTNGKFLQAVTQAELNRRVKENASARFADLCP